MREALEECSNLNKVECKFSYMVSVFSSLYGSNLNKVECKCTYVRSVLALLW